MPVSPTASVNYAYTAVPLRCPVCKILLELYFVSKDEQAQANKTALAALNRRDVRKIRLACLDAEIGVKKVQQAFRDYWEHRQCCGTFAHGQNR